MESTEMQSSGTRAWLWSKFGPGWDFYGVRAQPAGLMLCARKAITAFWLAELRTMLENAGRADAGTTRFRAVSVWARTGFGEVFASLVVRMICFKFH